MHIGFGQRHRVQMHRWLNLYIVGGDRLGDMLFVLLAFLGYIDHQVAENAGIAAQATRAFQTLL